MKLSVKEIERIIDCIDYTKETWDSDPFLETLTVKLQSKLKEIKGEESRLLSNSELKSMGL